MKKNRGRERGRKALYRKKLNSEREREREESGKQNQTSNVQVDS